MSAGGNISLVGAQINSQGFSASAGGNYEERAAYDVHERVGTSSTKMSGAGVYALDFTNNMTWLGTGGQAGGRTETSRATNNVDSTRTATVTNINAGGGTVTRNVGGDAFIEGSIVSGAVVNPLVAGGRTTLAAAVDTRHIENSTSTGTIRWQSSQSTGYIQQTLHMPEIHGTIPAGMSAYQGAGGGSVQLPAGSNVRAAIEQLSQQPGKEYLKAQVDQVRNTVTELAKLSGAGAALLIGGDATDMKTAMGTAQNAAVNNYLNHAQWTELAQKLQSCTSDEECNRIKAEYQALSAKQDAELREACKDTSSAGCRTQLASAMQGSATQTRLVQSGQLPVNYLGGSDLNAQARLIAVNALKSDIRAACASNTACTAKNDQAIAALASTLLDLTPVIGDAKAFYEAKTGLDYTLAVVGAVLPGAGDLAGKLIKEGRALFNAGDVAGAATKLQQANQTLHGVLIDAKAVSDRLTTLKATPEIKNVQLVEAGGKGNWSSIANGKLDADSAYVLSNGHAYLTDASGRVRAVEGDLSLNKMDRNGYQQLCAGQSGCVGDDGGHMIASALGGSGDRINMVPQASTLNRGDWKAMENELAGYLKQGKEVSVKVEIGYPAGGEVRPSAFLVEATINGTVKRFPFTQ